MTATDRCTATTKAGTPCTRVISAVTYQMDVPGSFYFGEADEIDWKFCMMHARVERRATHKATESAKLAIR